MQKQCYKLNTIVYKKVTLAYLLSKDGIPTTDSIISHDFPQSSANNICDKSLHEIQVNRSFT